MKVDVHVGRTNAGQSSDTDHSSGFAHRATTGRLAGYPLETFQGGFFWAGYHGFIFHSEDEFKASLEGVIVNPEMAYFDKPNRQDMLRKAADKFSSIERYRLFNTLIGVVFGNEGHFAIGNGKNPLIGDGHPMGVLSQISHHVIGICQRWFAVDYPFEVVSLLNDMVEKRQMIGFSQRPFQTVE